MTEPAVDLTVRRHLTVAVPPDRAFEVFTAAMSSWWPLETHHIGAVPAAEVVIEPRVGGRWYERGVDGSECEWGRVAVWEPPSRLVLSWQIDADWAADPDPARASEIEVRFTAVGGSSAAVDLEHRHIDRFGPRAEEMRDVFDSPGGWPGLLDRFAARLPA